MFQINGFFRTKFRLQLHAPHISTESSMVVSVLLFGHGIHSSFGSCASGIPFLTPAVHVVATHFTFFQLSKPFWFAVGISVMVQILLFGLFAVAIALLPAWPWNMCSAISISALYNHLVHQFIHPLKLKSKLLITGFWYFLYLDLMLQARTFSFNACICRAHGFPPSSIVLFWPWMGF